jgi:hypothetical protein
MQSNASISTSDTTPAATATTATTATQLKAALLGLGWPRAYPRKSDGAINLSTRPPGRGLWAYDPNPGGGYTITMHLPVEWSARPTAVSVAVSDDGALEDLCIWCHGLKGDEDGFPLAQLPAWRGLPLIERLVAVLTA